MNETSFTSDIIEKSQFEDSFNSQNLLSETCSNSERAENSEYQDSIIGCNTSERSQVEDLEYHNSFNSQNDSVSSDSIFEKSVEEPSVLEEINLPSPILKNSKRSPHIDIYEFVDEEPPPPIRAPEICDDDLFEKSSFAEDSDVLSIVSSALQTSGSSTESLPFGHLEFELPNIKTSTPMKTQFKGWTGNNISLLSKKTSAVAIKRAQKDCGCMKSCTSNLSRKEIKQSRLTYWNMTSDKRSKWIFEKCNDFQSSPSRNEQLSFRLKGQSVCKIAWLQAYGISKSSFYRCKTKWLNNSLYGKSSSNNQSLKEQKQTAIHWLGEYVAKRGERPPHQQEVWLPFGLRKNEIFNAYKNEQIMECRQFISSTAFYKIWKDFYGHVKIRSTNLFTKCTVCVKLDRALQFQLVPAKRQNIFREKQEHLHRIMMEKLAYYRRRTISRRRPDRYISLIIDGMDQAKTNLPHYKDRKGKDFASTVPLKTHVSAVISHGTNEKFVYTDLHQYPHDSNLTINILMKTLKNISQGKPLSPVLYLQADNCFRENKNKFVLSFLELLVQKRIFYEIQLSFLHVGHTHEDIDQMFSVFADKLRHTDAPTLPILRSLMAESKELGGCFDVSSWLEPYLAKVKYHTRSSIFRYRLDEAKDKVMVYYRKNSCQTWKVLRHGFFKVDNNEKPVYPSSTPSVLVMSFDKILLNDLNRSFEVWKSYMRNDEQDWWKKFIAFVSKMQSSQIALQQRSRNGAVWCLNTFRLFNRRALQDASDNTDPIPTDLRQQLQNEQGNPERSVGTFGLTGLDRLLCFMIVKELQNYQILMNRSVLHPKDRSWLEALGSFAKMLNPVKGTVGNPQKVYGSMMSKMAKLFTHFLDVILKVGQMQLLRRQIAHELSTSCKFDSKFLASTLQTFNDSLMADIERHYQDPSLPYPKEDNPLMYELTSYLESAGFHDPLSKIYITTKRLPHFPLFNFIMVISHLPKLVYSKSISGMTSKKITDPLDAPPFVTGCITLLKQFHAENTDVFLALLGQYVRSSVSMLPSAKSIDLSQDALNVLVFLEDFIYYSGLPRKVIEGQVPPYLFDEFKTQFAQG